jgi:hypothetical protein
MELVIIALIAVEVVIVCVLDIELNHTLHYVFTLLITRKLPYISHGHSPLNLYRPIIVEFDA